MLRLLHIENIAVIESAEVGFDRGLNVLTGETGAGKSVLIDSINMVLGGRVSRELIRGGTKKAYVSALFCDIGKRAAAELSELGVDCSLDGETVLEREITADGHGTCRINGRPVSTSQLRACAPLLIDIHGQNDSQALMQSAKHLQFLDAFARTEELLEKYHPIYDGLLALNRELDELERASADKERRADMLRWQMDEIEKAALREGEKEELTRQRDIMRNAKAISDAIDESCAILDEGAEPVLPARELLEQAVRSLSAAGKFDAELASVCERLSSLSYELSDCVDIIRAKRDELGDFPMSIEQAEDRLDVIKRLERKYGGTTAEVLKFHDDCAAELELMDSSEARTAELQRQIKDRRVLLEKAAAELTERRKKSAAELGERVMSELSFLDMEKVRFEAAVSPAEYSPTGCDGVEFLISTNPGEELRPLAKIASGGELSRIMLALKNVLAAQDAVDTLIFDEIDSGVSGRAAAKVAKKLRQIASGKQVLCVTHLVQIAAAAQHHYLIEKSLKDGRASTRVRLLDYDERTSEIARIIGGDDISELTRKNARELIDRAAE